jgi:hypothetical protein
MLLHPINRYETLLCFIVIFHNYQFIIQDL